MEGRDDADRLLSLAHTCSVRMPDTYTIARTQVYTPFHSQRRCWSCMQTLPRALFCLFWPRRWRLRPRRYLRAGLALFLTSASCGECSRMWFCAVCGLCSAKPLPQS